MLADVLMALLNLWPGIQSRGGNFQHLQVIVNAEAVPLEKLARFSSRQGTGKWVANKPVFGAMPIDEHFEQGQWFLTRAHRKCCSVSYLLVDNFFCKSQGLTRLMRPDVGLGQEMMVSRGRERNN